MNILLSKHKSHLQRDFWLELFSHLSEIFLIQKQQACFEKLSFRVLELQNLFMCKILVMKIFLSKHKSSQILKAAMRPMVFLWILYPLGNLTSVHRLTFTFCQLIRNAGCCVCWRTEFQKSQGVDCRWLFSMPLPLVPSPIVLAFARLYLLYYKP